MRLKRTVSILSTLVLASSLLLASGCGRSPVSPAGPDEPGAEMPGDDDELPFPDDPGYEPWPMPDPDEPGFDPVTPPAEPPAAGGGGNKPSLRPALKPISKPTPPPALSGGSGGGAADPDEAVDQFLDVLARFNYSTDRHDARMQLIVLTRVNPQWFKWEENPQLGLLFGNRKRGFGPDLTYAQWREQGLALARRSSPTTFYVARGPLYREVLTNWYQRPNPQELVFYKRLNNTPFMVSYRADGTVLDYGAFPEIDWRTFIEVPAAIWK